MNLDLAKEIVKGGIAMVLSVGIVLILYVAIKDDESEKQFRNQHLERQTTALETLVRIYSGN